MNPDGPKPAPEDNVVHVNFQTGEKIEPTTDAAGQPVDTDLAAAKRRHPAAGGGPHIAGVMPADVQQQHPRPPEQPPTPVE